ncbi:MAG: hypothetical protein K0R24_1612 [Gammaproteobacteria bacterium]|nr:hypothetical protein [Gammaproteobacteria bacterium]
MNKIDVIDVHELEPLLEAWGRWAGERITPHLGYHRVNIIPITRKHPPDFTITMRLESLEVSEAAIEYMEQVICLLCTHQPILGDIIIEEYASNRGIHSQRERASRRGLSQTEYRRRLLHAQQWLCGYFTGSFLNEHAA